MNTLMERYGLSQRVGEVNSSQGLTNWPSVFLGIIIGAVGGWVGSKFLKKKVVVSQ